MKAGVPRAGVAKKRFDVVLLGNVGCAQFGEKSYARIAPNLRIAGIDLKPLGEKLPKNMKQIRKGFAEGLERLEDNSVSIIKSGLALGHYDERGRMEKTRRMPLIGVKRPLTKRNRFVVYTGKVLEVAYRKLEKGGQLRATFLDERALQVMKKALEGSRFEQGKVTVKWVSGGKKQRPLPRIIAVK